MADNRTLGSVVAEGSGVAIAALRLAFASKKNMKDMNPIDALKNIGELDHSLSPSIFKD